MNLSKIFICSLNIFLPKSHQSHAHNLHGIYCVQDLELNLKSTLLSLQWTSTFCFLKRGRSNQYDNGPKYMDKYRLSLNLFFFGKDYTSRSIQRFCLATWGDFYCDLQNKASTLPTAPERRDTCRIVIVVASVNCSNLYLNWIPVVKHNLF